jgi:hypothetical protein
MGLDDETIEVANRGNGGKGRRDILCSSCQEENEKILSFVKSAS